MIFSKSKIIVLIGFGIHFLGDFYPRNDFLLGILLRYTIVNLVENLPNSNI